MARSMGGGGSRGGSRSFSGSGRSRSSSGGGHRPMSGGGSRGGGGNPMGGGHPMGGPHPGGPYHRPPRPRHYHHYYGGGPVYVGSGSGCGCSSIFVALILIVILIAAFISSIGGSFSSSDEKLNREKYTGSVDSSHGYYIDNSEGDAKFIDRGNETTLISGFKEFYNKTGVFPFLYIIENTPAKSEYSGYDTYQDMLYEKLFSSDGNLLILYIASEDDYYFAAGYDTGEIIDDESLDVICDKVNGYWSTNDLAKAFGNGFKDAAQNIMSKSNIRAIMTVFIIAIAVIVVIYILFTWWKKKKEQDNKEQEDLEKVLNTPLETFGNDIDDLTKKYDNQ